MVRVWKVYRFRRLGRSASKEVLNNLVRLNGLEEEVELDVTGRGVINCRRRVEVISLKNGVLVRFSFRGSRCWGEEFEVRVLEQGDRIEVWVRRTKGIGRVLEDYIARLATEGLDLARVTGVKGGAIVSIEGTCSKLTRKHSFMLNRWLEERGIDCEVVEGGFTLMKAVKASEKAKEIVSRGGVAICERYVWTWRALGFSVRAPNPDIVAVISGSMVETPLTAEVTLHSIAVERGFLQLEGDDDACQEKLREAVLNLLRRKGLPL